MHLNKGRQQLNCSNLRLSRLEDRKLLKEIRKEKSKLLTWWYLLCSNGSLFMFSWVLIALFQFTQSLSGEGLQTDVIFSKLEQ